MTVDDMLLTGVVALGLATSSIGVLGVLVMDDIRERAQGALCVVLGVACVVMGNLDAIGAGWVLEG